MPLGKWTKRSEETLHRNPWWRYKRDRVVLPSGDEGEYHYVQTPGSVMVIPVDDDGRFLLVRQYRYLNRRESIEFPAGGIKGGQDADTAARDELREEAGVEADMLEEIGSFNPFNGVTDELCRVYLAKGLHAAVAVPDMTEEFEQLRLDADGLGRAVADGTLWDGMTLAAWALFRATHGAALSLALLVSLVLPHTLGAQVRSGADVLLSDSLHLLEGKRVGLLANHTSRLSGGTLLFDTLRVLPGVTLSVVFSPEHGFRGTAADGESVASGSVAGVPLQSLYGSTRRPTPEMFAGIDVLVMDLQDIGVRYYTYLSTMAMCLEAAAEAGIPVIVCDRPNPIGGVAVEGPVGDDSLRSFVGYLPLPVRHGLTAGEALRMASGEGWLRNGASPELTVVPCAGWRRAMYFDETGLAWIDPSPNMRSVDAALAYAGTCLLEGTNVSEGRGTDVPFLQFGAPFIDGDSLALALNARGLPGVRFQALTFVPSPRSGAPRPRYSGQDCPGVRLEITDRGSFESFRTGLEILSVLRLRHGVFLSHTSYLDLLSGVSGLHSQPVSLVLERAEEDTRLFLAGRSTYLLYP